MTQARLPRLLIAFLLLAFGSAFAEEAPPIIVGPVPAKLRRDWRLSDFYQQHASVGGFPVLASAKVSPTRSRRPRS